MERFGNPRASATRERDQQAVRGHYVDYELLPPDLAHALRLARLRQGLSLREAARLVGISTGYLSRLERGLRAPRNRVALALTVALDLEDYLAATLLEEAASPSG